MEANEKLAALATLDGLTGLKNHRAFQQKLEEEYRRSRRYDIPLSLLMMDADHFKYYNDAFGHPAGDEVLKTLAHVLTEGARTTDFVARYGGEEFTVILPGTTAEQAVAAAERFRSAIETAHWPLRPVSVSVGVSTLCPDTANAAVLIREADRALYQSKASGRNRSTHSDDVPPASVPLHAVKAA
jgi:diguanylate cyclase (GGDEF)-like protein